MDTWKAEMGRVREKRRVEERRSEKRKGQKKEDAGAPKGRKVAKDCVFPMICGSGGSKSRLAKAVGAEPSGQIRDEKLHAVVARSTCPSQNVQNTTCSEHFWKLRCGKSARGCGAKQISKSKCTKHLSVGRLLEVERSKKCTPLSREAHFQVKMYKTPQCRTTFGSWEVEKVHAVVARSTFRSQNVQNTSVSDHFWKLRCRKRARRSGTKHISKSKCAKHHMFAPLLDVQMWFRVAGARDCAPSQKWAKREGFVAFPKTMAGVGHLKRICKDAFSVAGAVQERSSSELLGSAGGDFLRGVAFWSIRSSVCDRCSTSYDLASLFSGRSNTLETCTGKIAKRIGTRPSALHSTFHFWRKSRRSLSFLMLSTSKNEKVTQNCFVLDVVKLEYWGSLAELLRFWCCQLWRMNKSRRIASFLTLSSSNSEEVPQNCFVFLTLSSSNIEEVSQSSFVLKLADRQVDRQTDRQTEREREIDR